MKDDVENPDKAIISMESMISSSNTSLRITVIDLTGNVIADTDKTVIEENHLSRPEIQNLGTTYYRYSSTMGTNMMYIASIDETSTYYIRLSMPQGEVNDLINKTILYGSLVLIGVFIISVIVDYYFTKQSLKPLKEEADKLSSIVGDDGEFKGKDELEDLSYQIDKTKLLFDEKIANMNYEKDKLSYIIDTFKEGLVIINGNEEVMVINKMALNFFDKQDDVVNSKVSSLTIDPDILSIIEESLKGKEGNKEVEKGNKTYLISSSEVKADWCIVNKKYGAMVSIIDISSSKDLEKTKRDFFANASHELKSPLTSIIGYVEMIKGGYFSSKIEEEESLTRVIFEAKRMDQIVKEMLELSRLEAQTSDKYEEVSIFSLIDSSFSSLKEEADKDKVNLSKTGDDFTCSISREDGESLFKNLIENGIRYNKKGGSVVVESSFKEKKVIVKDDGIGIPDSDLDRIFERFYRVDKARSKKLGGTGLGLSIVKHICLNYGISVDVKSSLGKGTSFILTFKNKEIK